MAISVTTAQIRDLLNRPRGLNEGTITEYITIRTNEINKKARSATLYGITSSNAVTDDLKSDAIKLLVCMDCLQVLIDTVPSYYPEKKQGIFDQRFKTQMKAMTDRANAALELVVEAGGAAFYVDSTNSRITDTSDSNSG